MSRKRRGGVGTELQKIIPAIFKWKGCKCNDIAAKYDKWGIRACERRQSVIIAEMMKRAESNFIAKRIPSRLSQIQLQRWLTTAIARAKTNDKK